ncbi:(2Fe-2S) ferredoxin domain-containing protein [Cyanobacteria bacterium FACHB-DQ100]|uniref:(2Fe-2S) ferredoxin domain-containing protein n=1 Tax=unclassified Leptolyngbya TaxID=2650499 RepID=UPI001681AFAA|nr:(2Fe-2S) ferredoxin domain-containing protein [Leptolyngbya sp. FACHB-17]MBD1825632.1 (2Fe-2S) ferredoxin domain-containing protein [Cyanobacteria bacterium FACHB-DQ100]MBD2079663.1 (2Fe-2S) ferredoxin domain-containing protein [Leptolyngbya sp. FACHB-17]
MITVRVCQNKACRKQGAAKVLKAFQTLAPDDAAIEPSQCLGQCGNGAMVLVLPDEIWYCRVLPEEVDAIVDRHLIQGQPIKAMLYRKFHPN